MIDTILALFLIAVVPAYSVWRGFGRRGTVIPARMVRYTRSMALALSLSGVLIFDWLTANRQFADLGFDIPLSGTGLVGLGICAAVFTALGIVLARKSSESADAKAREADQLLPQTRREAYAFVAFIVVVGVAWEALYRGFLVGFLASKIGIVPAVVLAASAYALAHGYKSHRMFLGSLISALVFATGYALTHSLWWLIGIHIGLPLMGAFAVSRLQRG